ncbi:MAG: hypothetical protein R2909_02065 [Gemmatimonadales bacterium]
MHRSVPIALGLLVVVAGPLAGQDDPGDLVRRAIARRALEVDQAVSSYRARAHGLVTFLVEVGPAEARTTRLLKADELDVEVYWQGRGRSKQVIRAWRDTTYFPTGTVYHRDHLGIVTDDFGDLIRIGQGDEIRELPHPLGPRGLALYRFEERDTVRVRAGGRELRLARIDVRPRDPTAPLAIGTLAVDVDDASLVRSRFSFTAAAYRDPDLAEIVVFLERSLVDGQWLPYRQEIEITRRSAVLDFPLASVIRARWTIDDHELGVELPRRLANASPIGGLARPGGPDAWNRPIGAVLDSAARAPTLEDLDAARREIGRLAGGALLDGLPGFRLGVSRVSDLLRFNRVEGLRVGAGLAWRLGTAGSIRAWGGLGTVDERLTGGIELGVGLGGGRLSVRADRSIADVGPVDVASGVVASLTAQEGGLDLGDYVLLERVGVRLEPGRRSGVSVDLLREWAWSVAAEASPSRGAFRPNPSLGSEPQWVGRIELRRAGGGESLLGGEGRVALEVADGGGGYARLFGAGRLSRELPGGLLEARGSLGLGTARLPARRSFPLGGWGSLPGEPFRAYGGRSAAYLHLEGRVAVPGIPLPLGGFGSTAPKAEIGPFLAVAWTDGAVSGAPWRPSDGLRPVAGLAVELFDRSVRIEAGLPLRGSTNLGLTVDVARSWWPVL